MAQRTHDKLADLTLRVESYELLGLRRTVSGRFERHTTVVRLEGDGRSGLGEDVTYDAGDQLAFQRACRDLPLVGRYTLAAFSDHLEGLDLFPTAPRQEASRFYRRWALESAALDLALRQAERALSDLLQLDPQPVRFVVSPGLGAPPSIAPLRRLLELYPGLRLKLDATRGWTAELMRDLAASAAVDVVDFKGAYRGTIVDQAADVELYTRVVENLGPVWLEDPAVTEETEPFIEEHRDRITWDASIHSVADIEKLPFRPRMLNMKPSRFGRLSSLFDAYDHCGTRGVGMYGGGQFELGPGRGQIQYLASLFHPAASNDVAPGGYNVKPLSAGLPSTPLPPAPDRVGFRWTPPDPRARSGA